LTNIKEKRLKSINNIKCARKNHLSIEIDIQIIGNRQTDPLQKLKQAVKVDRWVEKISGQVDRYISKSGQVDR
jgi:siderophore synthetase component